MIFEIITHLCKSQVHIKLGYSPANATAETITKRDGAEVVDAVSSILADPTVGAKLFCTGEVFLIHGSGVMTQSQLSL